MFSCEFCEISKNTLFYRTPLMAASEKYVYHWGKQPINFFSISFWGPFTLGSLVSPRKFSCWFPRKFYLLFLPSEIISWEHKIILSRILNIYSKNWLVTVVLQRYICYWGKLTFSLVNVLQYLSLGNVACYFFP